jgi:hypothetical protein
LSHLFPSFLGLPVGLNDDSSDSLTAVFCVHFASPNGRLRWIQVSISLALVSSNPSTRLGHRFDKTIGPPDIRLDLGMTVNISHHYSRVN